MKERVLVTGGAGFIGSHTVDALIDEGYRVRILDNLSPNVHAGRKPNFLNRAAEFIKGDVRSRGDWLKALRGTDYIYHLAAYQDYLPDFSKFFDVNAVGTALLYEIILSKSLPIGKIVVASSQAVYGEGNYRCHSHGEFVPKGRELNDLRQGLWEVKCPLCGKISKAVKTNEETPLSPHNQYAMSKAAQESIALNLGRRYGIPTVALRYSIVQGARQSPRNTYSGLLRNLVIAYLSGQIPQIFEDGQQLRDYVNVVDAVKANLLVLQDQRADYQVFNVAGERPYTVLELAGKIMNELRAKEKPEILAKFRFGDTRHIISDNTRLKKLGWQPKIPVEQSIKEYVEWVTQQGLVEGETLTYANKKMKGLGVIRAAKMLSVVVPAYNEDKRIGRAIEEISDYLQGKPYEWELVVVDDGSQDNTLDVIHSYTQRYDHLKVVELKKNRGKGAAVQAGVRAATGRYILMTDADQSTPITELKKFWPKLLHKHYEIAIGSRGLRGSQIKRHQHPIRELLGKLFGILSRTLVLKGVRDTQCGFKVFRTDVAKLLFNHLTHFGAIWDIEILVLATLKGYQVAEVPVKWTHDPVTKIPYNLIRAIKIFLELVRIKIRYKIIWPKTLRKK